MTAPDWDASLHTPDGRTACATGCRVPGKLSDSSARRQTWNHPVRLGGATLTLRIRAGFDAPTTVATVRGGRIVASVADDLRFDPSSTPRVWRARDAVVLAFAADPQAGSGAFASLWRIGDRGRRIERLGTLRNADLRGWPNRLREFRPAKYATRDIVRAFPDVFDARHADDRFISTYRYDARANRLRLTSVAKAPSRISWPDVVRFPSSGTGRGLKPTGPIRGRGDGPAHRGGPR